MGPERYVDKLVWTYESTFARRDPDGYGPITEWMSVAKAYLDGHPQTCVIGKGPTAEEAVAAVQQNVSEHIAQLQEKENAEREILDVVEVLQIQCELLEKRIRELEERSQMNWIEKFWDWFWKDDGIGMC